MDLSTGPMDWSTIYLHSTLARLRRLQSVPVRLGRRNCITDEYWICFGTIELPSWKLPFNCAFFQALAALAAESGDTARWDDLVMYARVGEQRGVDWRRVAFLFKMARIADTYPDLIEIKCAF